MERASRIGAIFLVSLLTIFTVIALYLGYHHITRYQLLEREAINTAQSQADDAAAQISAAFADLKVIADGLADDLTNGDLAYADIEARMFSIVDERPDLDGLAITFEPFAYDPDLRLFQTYVFQQPDGSFDSLVGATYDYSLSPEESDNATTWYYSVIQDGAQWQEPFFAAGAQKILVEYGVPFYPVGENATSAAPAGIVTIDYTLEDVRDLMQALELGATGHGFVFSAQGTFLTHPVMEFVVNRSVFDLIGENDPLRQAAEQALANQDTFIETIDPITNNPMWYFFEPIEVTGWAVGVVIDPTLFLPDAAQTLRERMTIGLVAAAALFFGAATVFHVDRYRFTDFWWMSVVFSVLCLGLILFAWVQTNRLDRRDGIAINSPTALDRFIESQPVPAIQTGPPVEVPTGILIRAMQFPDPTTVTINGYIWQRYNTDDDTTVRGFSLPQRIGEEATLDEVQREVTNGEEFIVWYVGVTLRQDYDTTGFPFDHRNILVRLAPADLSGNVVLTPDLNAYELLNPRLLPGIDPQASINNWHLVTSGFSYAPDPLTTNIVINDRVAGSTYPELRFDIQAQRAYLGPFIAYLLPGLIATIMTFTYLVSDRKPGEADEIVSVLNYAAALFFVIAVIHTALREQIAAVGITYMENLFILLYLSIIAVAANVFAVARYPHWPIVQYKNNIIPKVLYWPVFAGGMLLATLVIFVY